MKDSNKRGWWIAPIIVIILLLVVIVYQYQRSISLSEEVRLLEESFPRTISEVKGAFREKYLDKKVTIEGYLAIINNRLVMIQNYDLFLMNMPIPEDRILHLEGFDMERAIDLQGALIQTKGTLIEVEKDILLEVDPIDIPFEVDVSEIYKMAYILEQFEIGILDWPIGVSDYAVLISGGWNSWNAHIRYWNDLKMMYSILINNYSYNPNRITVLYKDGVAEDDDMPVDYSATSANVTQVFQDLAGTISNNAKLFVFTTNHGGGFHPHDPYQIYSYGLEDTDGDEPENGYSEQTYGTDFNGDGDLLDISPAMDETLCLWDETHLRDDDLATLLNNINSTQTIVVMEQCFSGGFIHDLSGNDTIILTACHEEEFSWAADTEGTFDEFVYHFMDAVNTSDLSADDNNDGAVSMVEAFNYASQNDNRPESPQYDDNGDQVGHEEPIPKLGDGMIGNAVFLDYG